MLLAVSEVEPLAPADPSCARPDPADCASDQKLPAVGQFLDLQAENLVLMAFKQSEDNPCE